MSNHKLPSSSIEAKRLGYSHYFTGEPCKNGHIAKRLASTRNCVICKGAHRREWRATNLDKEREYDRARLARNPDARRAADARWLSENLETERERKAQYLKENPHKVRIYSAARRAAKINATPPWLTEKHRAAIERIYETCPEGWHVDHKVPLQGETVCGLHVPWNLEHLPASANMSKGNKL